MSNLPTNFANNDVAHSSQHNATNIQVNLNSLAGVTQNLSHTISGTLTIDAALGHSIHVDVDRDITLIIVNNPTVGLPGKLYLENSGLAARTVNLGAFSRSVGSPLPLVQTLSIGEVIEIEFVPLDSGDLWAPNGAILKSLGGLAPQPIDPSRLALDITPGDLSSWAQNRTSGIWRIAGNEFLPGDANDSLNLGDGYGLFWIFGDTIESFSVDSNQARLWFTAAPDGKLVIESRNVYVEDGSYSAANNQPAGNNSGINVPPSDALYKDSTISQFDANHVPVKIGSGADVVKIATSFVVEDWMTVNDFTTAIFSLEEPNQTKTAPVLNSIRNGNLTAAAKNSTIPIDPSDPNPPLDQDLVVMSLPAVGQWCTIIEELRVDPYGTAGFFNMWQVDNTGALIALGSQASGWGWTFNDQALNNSFFPAVMQNLQFHEFGPAGVVNNYVDTFGAARSLKTRFVALTLDSSVTTEELADHARFHLELPRG